MLAADTIHGSDFALVTFIVIVLITIIAACVVYFGGRAMAGVRSGIYGPAAFVVLIVGVIIALLVSI